MKLLGHLVRFAGFIERSIERAQLQARDVFLAQSVDHLDLELRMRELERAPGRSCWSG